MFKLLLNWFYFVPKKWCWFSSDIAVFWSGTSYCVLSTILVYWIWSAGSLFWPNIYPCLALTTAYLPKLCKFLFMCGSDFFSWDDYSTMARVADGFPPYIFWFLTKYYLNMLFDSSTEVFCYLSILSGRSNFGSDTYWFLLEFPIIFNPV